MDKGYGFCPKCGASGLSIERMPFGRDICVCKNHHTYLSDSVIKHIHPTSYLGKWKAIYSDHEIEVVADYRDHVLYGSLKFPKQEPKLMPKAGFANFYERVK